LPYMTVIIQEISTSENTERPCVDNDLVEILAAKILERLQQK
jgi:hypothetical protein